MTVPFTHSSGPGRADRRVTPHASTLPAQHAQNQGTDDMKLILTTTAALLFATTAFAQTDAPVTKMIGGCEVRQVANGNYFNKVDPSCSPDQSSRAEEVGLTPEADEAPEKDHPAL
jgi:hypothetical protein